MKKCEWDMGERRQNGKKRYELVMIEGRKKCEKGKAE